MIWMVRVVVDLVIVFLVQDHSAPVILITLYPRAVARLTSFNGEGRFLENSAKLIGSEQRLEEFNHGEIGSQIAAGEHRATAKNR
jgi:hypothetical protein